MLMILIVALASLVAVRVTEVDDPLADGSSLRYELVEFVSEQQSG